MSTLAKFLCIVVIAAFTFQMTTTNANAQWESEVPEETNITPYLVVLGAVIVGVGVYMIAKRSKKSESETESESTSSQSLYLNPLDSEIVTPHLLSSTSRKRNLPTLVLDMRQPDGVNREFFVGLSFDF